MPTSILQKFPPAKAIVAGIGILLAVRIPFPFTFLTLITQIRLSRTLAQVMTHSWTYSNVWATTSDA
jgi:hypothetical protein